MSDRAAYELGTLIVIRVSARGMDAVGELLGSLGPTFPAPIVVAGDGHAFPTRQLAGILAGACRLRVVVAERLEALEAGAVYVVPPNHELAMAGNRTSNEDLDAAHDQVEAAIRRVETLNEDLQATNEELQALKEELRARVADLNTANGDLRARTTELAETAASLAAQRSHSEHERARLAVILDAMGEAVLVVDAERRVVASNRAYDSQFGAGGELGAEDAAGNPLPKAEWPHVRAAAGETFSMTFTRSVPPDGDRRWYEATGRPAGEWGSVVVIRDITDRSLRHLQERFIDIASHELKTPLAALRNYLLLVERELGPGADAVTRRYLEGALDQSRRLVEFASRLFDVSVIRHGRAVVAHEPVDLAQLVRQCAAEAETAARAGQVQVRVPRAAVRLEGDAMRLRQLVGNMLANALTHGVSEAAVEVRLQRTDTQAVLTIADRGPGVPDGVRVGMFAAFSPGAAEGSGLGLGLYLAQTYATEHGGTLAIEARPGGGTIARLTLPLPPRRRPRSSG